MPKAAPYFFNLFPFITLIAWLVNMLANKQGCDHANYQNICVYTSYSSADRAYKGSPNIVLPIRKPYAVKTMEWSSPFSFKYALF